MLGFVSSRPNWDSPHPQPCVSPPFGSGGGGGPAFAGEGMGGSQFGREDRRCTLVYMYFLLKDTLKQDIVPNVVSVHRSSFSKGR
jgi:hypothetical protein